MTPKAPCGQEAAIKHFKTCQHEECKARYQAFLKAKTDTGKSVFGKFLSARKGELEEA